MRADLKANCGVQAGNPHLSDTIVTGKAAAKKAPNAGPASRRLFAAVGGDGPPVLGSRRDYKGDHVEHSDAYTIFDRPPCKWERCRGVDDFPRRQRAASQAAAPEHPGESRRDAERASAASRSPARPAYAGARRLAIRGGHRRLE